MAVSSPLTLHELARKDLPASPEDPQYAAWVEGAISAALKLVNSLSATALDPVWSKGKVHNGAQTYSTHSAHKAPPGAGDTDGFKWHARKSIHDVATERISYEHFERGLLRDHSVNESKYIESCTAAKQVEVVKAGELEGVQQLALSCHPSEIDKPLTRMHGACCSLANAVYVVLV
jgi:hypothetical protein